MSDDDIERYEDELELRLWREYRDVVQMFRHVVETEQRFYLANQVELTKHESPGGPWFELELIDAWVWDIYRPTRFVSRVRIVTTNDINIEELTHKEIVADSLGVTETPEGPDRPPT